MYTHIFEERRKLENKLNYLLAINALLILIFTQFFKGMLESFTFIYIIPAIFLLFPILILLMNFISAPLRVPWFELGQLLSYVKKDIFYKKWLMEIYNSAYMSFNYLKRQTKVIRLCLLSMGIAICWMIALFFIRFCACDLPVIEKILIIILFIFGMTATIYVLLNNLNDHSVVDSALENNEILNEWLNDRCRNDYSI